jgi:hypothetical protein
MSNSNEQGGISEQQLVRLQEEVARIREREREEENDGA